MFFAVIAVFESTLPLVLIQDELHYKPLNPSHVGLKCLQHLRTLVGYCAVKTAVEGHQGLQVRL